MYKRILLVVLAASALLPAAALKPYDAIIPNAFERNHGQSPPAFEYLVTHRNIGFSCQAMYWPEASNLLRFAEPFIFRIAGASAGCPAQLLDEDGTYSIYYRGANNAGGISPNPRFARLRLTQSQAEIEYRGTADSVVAQFSFRSVDAFRAFRLLWENTDFVSIFQPGVISSRAGAWKVRASAGVVQIFANEETHEISFDVSGATQSAPISLTIEMPTPRIPLADSVGVLDTRGNWYNTGSVSAYTRYDASAVVCAGSTFNTRCPDAFVAKFGPDAALRYLVYFLGNSSDAGRLMDLDSRGDVYVSGITYSTDFVTTPGVLEEGYSGPFLSTISRIEMGGDVFLAKLDGEGGGLIYSTYIGLGNSEFPVSLHADALGRTYLQIFSQSPNFPTWGDPVTDLTSCSADFLTNAQNCSYLISLDENAAGLRYSKRMPFFSIRVTAGGEVVTPAVRISAYGERVSTIDIPDFLRVTDFVIAPDASIWVSAYRGPGNATGYLLARAAPGASQFEIVRERLPVGGALEIDSGGNLWMTIPYYSFTTLSDLPSDFAPTADAPLRTPCPYCDGLMKVSPSGELLFATYLPLQSIGLAIGPGDEVRVYGSLQSDPRGRTYILDMGARPAPLISAIQDLSYPVPEFKAGNVLTILGMAIGPVDPVVLPIDAVGRVATEAGGVRVLIDGRPSPILAADSSRITFMVSHQTPDFGASTLAVTQNGAAISTFAINLGGRGFQVLSGPYAPPGIGVFNEDGTLNSQDNPANAGSAVRFYFVAAGRLDQPLIDGELQHSSLARPVEKIEVWLGYGEVELLSMAQAPDKVAGMIETWIRTPLQLPGIAPVISLPISPVVGGSPYSQFPTHPVYVAR